MVGLALEHWTGSNVACRRGDLLSSSVVKTREMEEGEEIDLCLHHGEREADDEVVGRIAGEAITFSFGAPWCLSLRLRNRLMVLITVERETSHG